MRERRFTPYHALTPNWPRWTLWAAGVGVTVGLYLIGRWAG